jgi:hypothetical protein
MMLEGVGHVAQMEVPRTVARAVLGLLDELQGAAAQQAAPQVATQVRDGVRQRAPQVRMAS